MKTRFLIAVLLSVAVLYGAVVNGYMDFTLRSAPSNPASGNARVYVSSSTNALTCILSSGASCMPSGATFADNETPSGTLNGSNTSFTIAHSPVTSDALRLYLNGVLQLKGTDYMISGTTITYTVAPVASDWHRAYYRY